ncbi:MAG: carbohydrate ABC transporter permease [Spirochaetales bacterium]|nr:carbohydrate ABC transporter permease [Spirochaetales bacterium]
MFLVVLICFIFYMFPFLMVALNSFKAKRDIITAPFSFIAANGYSFSNYAEAFLKMNFLRSFSNSLIVTGLATVLVTLFSAMCAYYFVRYQNKFSKICSTLMASSIIIPFQSLMIPLVYIYGARLGILNHRSTLIFMHIGFAMSMSTFIFQGFIKANIPLALEEAATIDGCGKYRTFFQIVFPLLTPTTVTLVILNVLAFWNDYLLPSLVLSKKELLTLPLSTYTFYGTYSANYGVIMAALVLTVLPILILYLALQKMIINGVVAGAVK